MPDPTEPSDPALGARLSRLAPGVDPDAATTEFARRRVVRARRRRALTAGAVAATVLVVAGLAAALVLPGDDRQQVYAGSTTEAPVTTVAPPVGLEEGEIRTSTEDQGLVFSMDTPPEATVGERMWVDVTFTNDRPDAVTVDPAAPCREPVGALAGGLEAIRAVAADTGFGAFDADRPGGAGVAGTTWSGDLDELPQILGSGVDPKVYTGRAEDQLTMNSIACDWVARPPETVAPGVSVTRRIAIDLRWVTPRSVDGESLEVLASTGAIKAADGRDLGNVTVQQPVALRDPEDRRASYDAAVAPGGIAAAPTLPAWIVATMDMGPDVPPGFVQQYATGLSWWNGAWEAWILPGRGDGHQTDPLRIRFDPDRMEVVDVRTVFWNQAPSDDPDQPEPTEPVEDVRYHVD